MDKDKKKIIAGAGILGGAGLLLLALRKRGAAPGPSGKIILSNLSITPATVYPNQTVTISVLAANNNTVSTLSTTVTLGGDFMSSQMVSLNPGESKVVSFTVTPTTKKTYNVSVDGLSGSFVCTAAPHADIRAENLVIEPSICYVGDTVTISVTVTNYGDAPGVKTIVCTVT